MRLSFFVITAIMLIAYSAPSKADAIMSAAQQQCTTTADCTFVSLTCGNACASVPINTAGKTALEPTLRNQCGGKLPEESETVCHMNPPLQPACVNSRCTVGYAFENNASSGDYQTSLAPATTPVSTPVSAQ